MALRAVVTLALAASLQADPSENPTTLRRACDAKQNEDCTRLAWKYAKGDGVPAAPKARRQSKHPLVEIGRARKKADALAGLDRWKARHPDAVAHLEPADVLVDAMRGRFQTWTRIRVNLQHVPETLRPEQEPLDPDDDLNDWPGSPGTVSEGERPRRRPSRARKEP